MSNANNSSNTISDGANGIGRSTINARFQISKVSDDDPYPKKILDEVASILIRKSNQYY